MTLAVVIPYTKASTFIPCREMQNPKHPFRGAQITLKSAFNLPYSNASLTNAVLMCFQRANLVADYRNLAAEEEAVMPAGVLPVPD
jgi:hypothetical protein